MHMNKEKLVFMWRDLSETPPARICQVILEPLLQAKLYKAISQGDHKVLADNRSKEGGGDFLKAESKK